MDNPTYALFFTAEEYDILVEMLFESPKISLIDYLGNEDEDIILRVVLKVMRLNDRVVRERARERSIEMLSKQLEFKNRVIRTLQSKLAEAQSTG